MEFIAFPGVSVTLHLFHALCNIQSPFVEFAFHKFTQIWHTVKSHTNVCSCRLKAKLYFCASFVWALKKTGWRGQFSNLSLTLFHKGKK